MKGNDAWREKRTTYQVRDLYTLDTKKGLQASSNQLNVEYEDERRQRKEESNSLVSSLLQPELHPSFHIPCLLIPSGRTFRRSSLLLKKLLGNSNQGVTTKLDLVLFVSNQGRRDHVGVAISTKKIGVGRVSIRVVLRGGNRRDRGEGETSISLINCSDAKTRETEMSSRSDLRKR